MDGEEATATLRAKGYTTPIVGVTGNALDNQREKFLAVGANEIVPKPINKTVLSQLLTKYVKGKVMLTEMRIEEAAPADEVGNHDKVQLPKDSPDSLAAPARLSFNNSEVGTYSEQSYAPDLILLSTEPHHLNP
jgi:CheY-like chemotaxis protein